VARGSCGIEIDVARVSRREAGMVPHEIMLSESQERMLLVVRAGTEDRVQQVFGRWELLANVIGRTTDDGMVRICDGEEVAAELPAAFLSGGAPEFTGAPVAPRPAPSAPLVPPYAEPSDFSSALGRLLGSPNLTSRRVVYEQYDHMVQINTVVPPGEGAAVLRVKGTRKGLVLGLGSHPRHCALDARGGGALAVVEACRNVACAGARPIAVTNCLNFGDPERPRVWQDLSAVVEGMRDACLALDVPIISGNVSLYNESDGAPIPPTPVVGVLGILEQVEHCARAAFQADQEVWLLGALRGELGASEYASFLHGWDGQPGEIDLDSEVRVQRTVRSLVEQGITPTATDVADGGLAIALAELALTSGVGVTCEGEWLDALAAGSLGRRDGVLFGEGAARVIVACARANAQLVREAAAAESVPLTRLGWTGGDEIRIGDLVRVSLAVAYDGWAQALDRLTAGVGGGRRDP
jgi:phosphoribosylformylglycinamidine synthase